MTKPIEEIRKEAPQLWRLLKAKAVYEGVPIRVLLLRAIKEYLDRHGAPGYERSPLDYE